MIELSQTQDEDVGDGTTSVIVLAGEMLHVAEAFNDKKYHPTVICRAYIKALEDALTVLDKISMSIDVNDRSMMLGLVKSCIGTKFTNQFGDLIAKGKDYNRPPQIITSGAASTWLQGQATEQDDERRDPHQNWVDEVDRSEATGAIIEPDSSYMTVKPQVV
ncbi:T-complex protein 1 subunit gamma [Tanacetum coccineum]